MAQTTKRGLGRGFDALISQDFDKSLLLTPEDRIEKIPVSKLVPNPFQPRKHFEQSSLDGLAASIKRYGIVQPLVVSPAKNGTYTLVAGERRWRASQIAGLETVPAIVRERAQVEQLEVALIENIQRVDLNPIEQAISIERLHVQFSVNYDKLAERLGKAPSTIGNTVRLLQLPENARTAIIEGRISEGHGRSLLSLKDDQERQDYLLKMIIDQSWSVRQAERFVLSVKAGVKDTVKAAERAHTETPVTKALSKRLGYPVAIRRMANGGKLEITFTTDKDLDKLLQYFDTVGKTK